MVQAEIKTTFEVGPVTFTARHELWDGNIQDHADQGVSIVVQAEVDGKKTTLIRFNCFDIERSYIYGPENPDLKPDGPMMLAGRTENSTGMGKLFRMDPTADGNPIGWTMKTIKKQLPEMLDRAGYPEIAKEIDLEVLADVVPELEASARELFVAKRNTVKHNRGTDIFEAGNIRFGLEMRRLPVGDGGLAIHVLTDVGGSDVVTVGGVLSNSTLKFALNASLPFPAGSKATSAGNSTDMSPFPSGVIVTVKSRGPPVRATVPFATLKSLAVRPVMSSVKLKTRSNGPLTALGGVEVVTTGDV